MNDGPCRALHGAVPPTVRVIREISDAGQVYYTYDRREGAPLAVWYAFDNDASARRSLAAEIRSLYGLHVSIDWLNFAVDAATGTSNISPPTGV